MAPLALVLAGCPVFQPSPPGEIVRLQEPRYEANYYLYVPTNYSEDRRWPLVVTLHGTHGWDGARRQVRTWGALAEEKGFLVVAPRLQSVQGIFPVVESWWYEDLAEDERNVIAVVQELCRKYTIDNQVIFLTGFSAGGYPLYYIGLRNPLDRTKTDPVGFQGFHMLIARDCNCDSRVFRKIEVTQQARNMPIVIFWGKSDFKRIHDDSWDAFRWLRLNKFFKTKRREIQGAHLRRPDVAYKYWVNHLPPRYRR